MISQRDRAELIGYLTRHRIDYVAPFVLGPYTYDVAFPDAESVLLFEYLHRYRRDDDFEDSTEEAAEYAAISRGWHVGVIRVAEDEAFAADACPLLRQLAGAPSIVSGSLWDEWKDSSA
jgi:hypothetical protein